MTLTMFLKHLKMQRDRLTKQQFKTIRGQAIAGDIVGAKKGLIKLLSRG